jgi:translation initiation factor 3 subunit M
MVSSTLVSVAEDAEVRLVNLLSSGQAPEFATACQQAIASQNHSALVSKIVQTTPVIATLVTMSSSEEAVSAITVLCAILNRVTPTAQQPVLSQLLADALVSVSGPAVARSMVLLSTLYNMRTEAVEKCDLLRRIIQLASTSPQTYLAEETTLGRLLVASDDEYEGMATKAAVPVAMSPLVLIPPLPRIVLLLDSWKLSPTALARRELYRAIAGALPLDDVRKLRFQLLLVATFDATAGAAALRKQAAVDAVVATIRDPITLFRHSRNLLSLPAVVELSKSETLLFGLLQIFQQGQYADYIQYLSAQGGAEKVLQPHSLDPTACQRYMRILTLCSLAADHEEIPYPKVADSLQLTAGTNTIDEQVESWVIAAVGTGLLQAKMDQLQKVVLVERTVVRRFDQVRWTKLQKKLRAWKTNVGQVLSTLQQTQQPATGA